MEGELQDFINYIFESTPKEHNSITLQIPTDEDGLEATKTIFDALLMIFNGGMKLLFGNEEGRVDITELTLVDIGHVQEYFKSFGFHLILNITNPNDHDELPGTTILYDDKLENCKLRLVSNKNNTLYIISFNFSVFN